MNPHVRCCLLAALVALFTYATAQTTPPACSAPEYHQFDFWLGDWDVYDLGSKHSSAHVKVDRILDGCVIHELYKDSDGLTGESFSIYDKARGVWHQTWVTSRGSLLMIEGGLRIKDMVLAGEDRDDAGRQRKVRGTWAPQPNGVRETASRSLDGGRTWQQWFDLEFRPAGSVR